ncbi:muscarinic acetylcholine receptor M2-like [Patiria miniata]|uniref:G-protein coupled receptors family 1 profile domain-containing protein n=1 Tax=Patiria miniata TaxID=46514 RepID=A0A913Z210_PATMI|nr:muscarinic acetylcholine receptor M2-like [Patiria miniata]
MDINASVSNTTNSGLDELNDTMTTSGFEPPDTPNYGWVVFQFVFYVLVIVAGVLGNGLIIRVYSIKARSVKTTTAVLVMALALSDMAVCVFRFRNLGILRAHLTQEPISLAILYLEIPDKFVIATTVALTGLIAFDRYDCVCRPHNRLLAYKSALGAAVGCFAFSVLANAPLVVHILIPFFQPLLIALLTPTFQVLAFSVTFVLIVVCYSKVYRRIRQHVRVGVGSSEARPRVVLNGDKNMEPLKMAPALASALTSTYPTGDTRVTALSTSSAYGPSTSTYQTDAEPVRTCVSTSLTVPGVATDTKASASPGSPTKAHHHPSEGQSSHRAPPHPTRRPDGQRRRHSLQRKTTRMLFITSVVFILTWLPQGVYVGTQLVSGYTSGPPVSSDAVFNLKPLLFFNNVINPLIYGLANRRFREDCLDVLKKLKKCFCRI